MRSKIFQKLFFLIIYFINNPIFATILESPTPIGPIAFSQAAGLFFVGASQISSGTASSYALSVAGKDNDALTGIAPEFIYMNGQEISNPLYGSQIALLATTAVMQTEPDRQVDSLPAVTLATDPDHIYITTSYTQGANPTLVMSNQLIDANGLPVGAINSLCGSIQGSLFALVSPNSGTFGDTGGGLVGANLIATQTGYLQCNFSPPSQIDRTSPYVAINGPLQSINPTSLYVSTYKTSRSMQEINIGTLFASFTIKTGANPTNGGLSVLTTLGEVGGQIALAPIVATSAITQDSIIATTNANTFVSAHFISTLFPSVGTNYLVVVGGVGPENQTPINVFALPLTSNGMLASVNSVPITIVNNFNFFLQREFIVPAVNPGDLYTSSSIQAQVGGGIAPGTITSLYTSGDSVVITVFETATQAPGIFYSQALFDTSNKISAWTPWQRAVQTQGLPKATVYSPAGQQFWYTTEINGELQTLVRTSWNKNSTSLCQLLNETLPEQQAGLQGFTDLVYTSPFFSQAVGSRVSAALFTGYQTVILAQTAADLLNLLTPTSSYPTIIELTDGTFNAYSAPTQYIAMTGGVLQNLEAIIASTVVTDGSQSWIVVGGNGGLAILALPDGTGIGNGAIQENFSGFSTQLYWQPLGNYTQVRKLLSQDGNLYVLTDTLFERVQITPALINKSIPFASSNLATASTLANGLYLFFSDMIISGPMVIIATSSGLITTGNGASITTAPSQAAMNWKVISMPETTGCATRFFPLTQTGQQTDLYLAPPGVSGNFYVLAGNVSLDQARIYRYVITYSDSGINDNTIQLFNDFFIANKPSFFINIGAYRNFFYTDGLLWSTSRSRYIETPLFEQSLPINFKIGSRAKVSPLNGFFSDVDAHSIGQLQRPSGLGSWIIPGDFGLVVHY